MITQKKTSKKRNMVMGIIVGIALIITLVIVYFGFIRQPDIGVDVLGNGLISPGAQLNTEFNTSIFEDSRIQNLKQFGPSEVQVQFRGRSEDPFQPF